MKDCPHHSGLEAKIDNLVVNVEKMDKNLQKLIDPAANGIYFRVAKLEFFKKVVVGTFSTLFAGSVATIIIFLLT